MKRVSAFRDQFLGHRVYSPTAGSNIGHNWLITDTSAAGTPTYAPVDGGKGLKTDLEATSEVQNVCASWGDKLGVDIDDILEVRIRIKQNQATIDAASSLAFGVAGDRNDAIDSVAQHALFRLIGNNNLVCESDDGTTDKDDVATGKTLSNAAKDFLISFALGKGDVRFFVDGEPVAEGTKFDMSAYTGALQPFVQLQKTADTNADGYTLEDFEIIARDN